MSVLLASYEKILVEKLKKSDKSAFSVIFTNYYADLVRFSFRFTKNPDVSEELVQDVFVKLWENRSKLFIQSSIKSYLLKSVQNRSLDWLRHKNIKQKYASSVLGNTVLSDNETENFVLHSELESNLEKALSNIPVQYAEVFRMSRFEFLNHSEIAEKLEVSVRTVEVRISKALLCLRDELKDYLVLWFLLILQNYLS